MNTLIEYNAENEEIIPFRGVQFPRGYPYPKLKQLRASRPLKSEGIYKYNAIKHIAPQRGRLAILPYRPVQNTPCYYNGGAVRFPDVLRSDFHKKAVGISANFLSLPNLLQSFYKYAHRYGVFSLYHFD